MATNILVAALCCVPSQKDPAELRDPFQAAVVTAIHQFAGDGKLRHVQEFIKRNPKLVSSKKIFPDGGRKPSWTDGFTPLHHAVRGGKKDVIAYLIENGADVNAPGPYDWTPLHIAAQNGNLAVVIRLVMSGAKVNAKTVAVPESSGDGDPGDPESDTPPKVWPAIPPLTPLDLAKSAKRHLVVGYLRLVK
ncbi:MAG: ankyrin repeat domain-containing protein [Planctomycetes bacterium]|nr:ankyrin repeat domain-containing protein [Planctomycetota bacterium]